MKISEVFYNPIPLQDIESMDDLLGYGFDIHSNEEVAKAAAHAINCHDDLVEALEHCLGNIKGTPLALKVNKALVKARGEK